jgi:hypothetical protein
MMKSQTASQIIGIEIEAGREQDKDISPLLMPIQGHEPFFPEPACE